MIQKNNRLIDLENQGSVSGFLFSLFGILKNMSIDYCVLRNYEALPYNTGGSDVDILIDFKSSIDIISSIKEVARKFGGKLIVEYKSSNFYGHCFCGSNGGNKWGVQLDIYTDETYKGITFFDKQLILSRAVTYNDLKVASNDDAMFLGLLKETLANSKSRKNYEEQAREAYCKNRQFYSQILVNYFGERSALEWDRFFNLTPDHKSLKKVSWIARCGLLFTEFTHHPFKTITKKIQYGYLKYRRLWNPIGFSVAFIGPDGSGKSTIIEGIRPSLESALHSTLKYEHMRPNLLPSLAQLLGGKPHEPGKPVTDPHGSTKSGFVGSLLRLSYYSLDYVLGYWFKVYPDMVKKPCLYVFDRYYYDFILDPIRSRISLPKKLMGWFQALIPEPALVLCLGADPEVIHARKPELPLSEVERQVDELRNFCDGSKRAVWVDTGLSIEESTNQALSAIVDRMAARYE